MHAVRKADLSASVSECTETMRMVLISSGSPVVMSHSKEDHSACRWLVHHCPKATAACNALTSVSGRSDHAGLLVTCSVHRVGVSKLVNDGWPAIC